MARKLKAFTLVELLVVIGIIAILVAILLPALSRARAQSNQVYCASNLRQLYTAMQIYATTYNQYVMPSRTWRGSSRENFWCGVNVLGPVYGVKLGAGANSAQTLAALNRISKMLDCPAVDRPKSNNLVTTEFSVDYTYNSNLGDDRSIPANPDYSPTYPPWASFKRTTQVPQNVIVAVDSTDIAQPDDERFRHIADLTVQKRYGGIPHIRRANLLFYDGTVRTASLWDRLPKNVNPYNMALPISDPNVKSNPLLEDWMFRTEKWNKGRPIPSF